MLKDASKLTLSQDDINTAVQYWLNKEILTNDCYVTDVKFYIHSDGTDQTRSFIVEFSPAGSPETKIEASPVERLLAVTDE